MTTYDRNRNAITTGSRVMVSGTGHTGKILSIDTEGLTAEQIRRGKTVVVEGCEEKLAPLDLIRLGMNYACECRRWRHCFFTSRNILPRSLSRHALIKTSTFPSLLQ